MDELRFDITVDPGLEDIAETECRERFGAAGVAVETWSRPLDLPGHLEVLTAGAPGEIRGLLATLRTAYYAVRLYRTVELSPGGEPLEALLEAAAELRIPELDEAESFCVRCRRVGEHSFSSPEVERRLGAVLYRGGERPVDLEEPGCTVRVDITGGIARLGVLYTSPELNRRYPWVWRPRVTLRTTIAYAMLRLAGILELPPGATLYDPFCGSGTIPIEAASIRGDLRILGSDYAAEAIIGARKNAEASGLGELVTFSEANALECSSHVEPARVEAIVTNPPFGVRLARGTNMRGFYHSLLREAAQLLAPEGRLVILVGRKRKLFNEAVEQLGRFSIRHVRVIEFGGVFPGLFVLEPLKR